MKRGYAIALALVALGAGYVGAEFAPNLVASSTPAKPQAGTPPPATVASRKSAAAAPSAAPAISVVRVSEADFVATVVATGSLVPRNEILVAPEIEGLRVVALEVEEGDRVTKGQVLARLVQLGMDAQIAQNEAAAAKADAAIAQTRSQIVQAEARDQEAQANFARAAPLRKTGTLPQSVFEQREAAARTAQAQVVAARDGLKVAEAERAQVKAQRRELDWRMSNTAVKAPAGGIVSRRIARVGALATAVGEPMFRIIADGAIELEAQVPESDLARIRPDQRATVSVAGLDTLVGRVRLVSPEIDKATRLGRVRILIDDPKLSSAPHTAGSNLKIGAFATGRIETGRSRGLAVPASALLYDGEGVVLQVVRNGSVGTRRVTAGLSEGGRTEIVKGLVADEMVVIKAGTFLRHGDRVAPVIAADAKVSEVN